MGRRSQFSSVNSPCSFVVAVGGLVPQVSWPMMALAPFTGRPAASTTRPVTVSPFLRIDHAVEVARHDESLFPLIMRMFDRPQTSARFFGATSSRQRPWASVLGAPA